MDEDDDAFLYGESSPPPAAAPEVAQTPEVTTAKPDVTPTRSSFPLSPMLDLMFSRCCRDSRFWIICCYGCVSWRLQNVD
jgi:hypothetical protein